MANTLLEVNNLQVQFSTIDSTVTAVDGVSFSVNKGETLGVVGESGCGKSVTSMAILRLLGKTGKITQGEILFEGQDILKKSESDMCQIRGKEISMIFQDSMTGLNPVMTIGKQLIGTITVHEKMNKKTAEKKAIDMLKKVGIPSPEQRMNEYPHQLSGGMRQRVMIAMALSCNPSLLIADEPTTALDVTIQAQIIELMKDLKKTSEAAIIIITHDLGVVAEMADRIMVMYSGQVVEYADARSIFTNPLHPYTRGLLASIPRLDKDVDVLYAIKGSVPSLQNTPKGCRFYERCQDATEICKSAPPVLCTIGDCSVRCWKYTK